jgi:hypothetical protein
MHHQPQQEGQVIMTFTTRNLTGERVLVSGQDIDGTTNKTVLDASQWIALNERDDVSQAQADFESAVEAFFKPLTDAADAAAKAIDTPKDGIGYVVIEEGEEPTAGKRRQVVTLTHDSIVLRLIEQGDTDRLLWVGDKLEVIEAKATTSTPAPATPDYTLEDNLTEG